MGTIPSEVTFAIALLGAVLGICNTWRAFDRDRVRLRVIPRLYWDGGDAPGLCIEVINLGYLPVTVTQVAFALRRPSSGILAFTPEFLDDTRLPHRLEARTAITVLVPRGEEEYPVLGDLKHAFVKTACGRCFRGSSPALRAYAAKFRSTR